MRTLEVIQNEVKSCTKCELSKTRTQTVFSRGNPEATICFIGEAAGEEEDLQGRPFAGKSGQLLDTALLELDLNVENDIYVCNIIKCRPPNNRRPTEDEINSCSDYLNEQLKLIKPKVIVALGNTAIENLVNTAFGITKIRGKIFKRQHQIVIPTYHPSYLLRSGGSGSKFYAEFKQDITLAISKSKELMNEENKNEK